MTAKQVKFSVLLITTEAMVAELPQQQSWAMPGGLSGGIGF